MPFCWRMGRKDVFVGGGRGLVFLENLPDKLSGFSTPFSKILTKTTLWERKFSPFATEKYIIYFAHERSHINKKRERERERERKRER